MHCLCLHRCLPPPTPKTKIAVWKNSKRIFLCLQDVCLHAKDNERQMLNYNSFVGDGVLWGNMFRYLHFLWQAFNKMMNFPFSCSITCTKKCFGGTIKFNYCSRDTDNECGISSYELICLLPVPGLVLFNLIYFCEFLPAWVLHWASCGTTHRETQLSTSCVCFHSALPHNGPRWGRGGVSKSISGDLGISGVCSLTSYCAWAEQGGA